MSLPSFFGLSVLLSLLLFVWFALGSHQPKQHPGVSLLGLSLILPGFMIMTRANHFIAFLPDKSFQHWRTACCLHETCVMLTHACSAPS